MNLRQIWDKDGLVERVLDELRRGRQENCLTESFHGTFEKVRHGNVVFDGERVLPFRA